MKQQAHNNKEGNMTIYNNYLGKIRHICDRPPTNQDEIAYLDKLFPNCVLKRKSNNASIPLGMVKIKNIHWYK